jgi:hypothetical protein
MGSGIVGFSLMQTGTPPALVNRRADLRWPFSCCYARLADMNAKELPALLYLAAVVWAVVESGKRWMTLLWIVVSLAAVIAMAWLLSLIWPSKAAALGDMAGFLSWLSALVGISHMRANRRPAATPKP